MFTVNSRDSPNDLILLSHMQCSWNIHTPFNSQLNEQRNHSPSLLKYVTPWSLGFWHFLPFKNLSIINSPPCLTINIVVCLTHVCVSPKMKKIIVFILKRNVILILIVSLNIRITETPGLLGTFSAGGLCVCGCLHRSVSICLWVMEVIRSHELFFTLICYCSSGVRPYIVRCVVFQGVGFFKRLSRWNKALSAKGHVSDCTIIEILATDFAYSRCCFKSSE